jgi:hypothetical protein
VASAEEIRAEEMKAAGLDPGPPKPQVNYCLNLPELLLVFSSVADQHGFIADPNSDPPF